MSSEALALPATALGEGELPADLAGVNSATPAPQSRLRQKVRRAWGLMTLLVLLSFCSVIPFVQFFCLAYLIEVSRRAAANARFSDAFPGVDRFARVGCLLVVCGLLLSPIWLLWNVNFVGQLISPEATMYRRLGHVVLGLFVLFVGYLAIVMLSSTPRIWRRPWTVPGAMRKFVRSATTDREQVLSIVIASVFKAFCSWTKLFMLGVRGYLAAALWLVVPTLLMYYGPDHAWSAWTGGALLSIVSLWLPLAATRFAVEDRLAAAFEWRALCRQMSRVPGRTALTVIATALLNLPLTALKVEPGPWQVYVLLTFLNLLPLLFLRYFWGRVYAAAAIERRAAAPWWSAACVTAALPFAVFYAVVVFHSQYYSWLGAKALLSQQSYLLPVAF